MAWQPVDVASSTDLPPQTLLHVACHAGHVTVLQLLLARGMDVNAIDSDGRTALHNACLHSQLPCVLPLTAAMTTSALLVRDHNGCTAMHYALGQPQASLPLHLLQIYPDSIKDVWVAISTGTQPPTQVAWGEHLSGTVADVGYCC